MFDQDEKLITKTPHLRLFLDGILPSALASSMSGGDRPLAAPSLCGRASEPPAREEQLRDRKRVISVSRYSL